MILEEFDDNKIAVFNAFDITKKMDNFPKTVIAFFSHDIIDEFKKVYKPEIITTIKSITLDFPVYKINSNGDDIGVIQAPLGAPYIVELFEEVVALGAKNILIAGSCGCLSSEISDYSIILPTSAIRDEGTSYHYKAPSTEIEVNKNVVNIIEKTLNNLKIRFHKGKTWTTDAIYRETPKKLETRKNQGAIVVDMECSAMASFAEFRGVNFGEIFYGADDLSKEEYDVRTLLNGEISKQAIIIPILIKCAENLNKEF